ncbi:hypothetical protein B9Q01_07850 [Candidatus Marsarchaeota G1 archaeon OSP_D]|jgi:hypothetical protein|uniref:Uncharacterized protein n=2 Tax=Candidatus Marsarchaeota group 1 TaxID=2203770 RepID=A0A2R6A838_9ARCH|nr:MAG: hypothetical protein B9Q01_07850 [Candidatus Marsarchaeota G1 archaeon OSP_D]PSN87329.1 MAG: hypothetical protein B9Q00_09180 [Candidatus Marsarchaeota G1 archaeon OSP_C]
MSKAISRVVLAVVVIVVIIAVVGAAIALTHKSTTITPSASSSSLITSATTTPVTLTLVTFSDPANEWMQYAASVFEAQHPRGDDQNCELFVFAVPYKRNNFS